MANDSLDITYSSPYSEILIENAKLISAKCHFPRYFRASTLFDASIDRTRFMLAQQDPFDSSKIMRKYDCKKTVHVTCNGTQLSKFSNQRLKVLKSLCLRVPNKKIKPHIGVKKLSITDHHEFIKTCENIQHVCKSISAFKNLQFLELDIQKRTFSFKEIRKMRCLTSIKLKLSEKQLLKSRDYVLQLKKLEKVDITIEGIHTDKSKDKEVKLLEFLQQLIRQNKLKALRLNLLQTSGHSISDFLIPLLIELNMSQTVVLWDIQIKSMEYNGQEIINLSKHISKIDFLGLRIEEFDQNNSRLVRDRIRHKLARLKEVTPILVERQKILDIYVSKTCLIPLGDLLNSSLSLKGLFLSFGLGAVYTFSLSSLPILGALQNAVIMFKSWSEPNISCTSVPASLIRTIKNNAKCLESLNLCHEYPKATPKTFIDTGVYTNEIVGMSSLRKLNIDMASCQYNMKSMITMIESMHDLKELEIVLKQEYKGGDKTSPLSLLIPYEKLQSLTKLKIWLSSSFGEENLLHLADNITNLPNLKTLICMLECQINVKFFENIMLRLSGLKKLKALILVLKSDSSIEDDDSNKDEIIKRWGLREHVTRMASLNSNLKKVCILLGDISDVEYSKYT